MKKFKFQLHEDDRDSKLLTIAKFEEFPTLDELNDAVKNINKTFKEDIGHTFIFTQKHYDDFDFQGYCDYVTSDDVMWLFEINRI